MSGLFGTALLDIREGMWSHPGVKAQPYLFLVGAVMHPDAEQWWRAPAAAPWAHPPALTYRGASAQGLQPPLVLFLNTEITNALSRCKMGNGGGGL